MDLLALDIRGDIVAPTVAPAWRPSGRLLSDWVIDRRFGLLWILGESDAQDLDVLPRRKGVHDAGPRVVIAGSVHGIHQLEDLHPTARVGHVAGAVAQENHEKRAHPRGLFVSAAAVAAVHVNVEVDEDRHQSMLRSRRVRFLPGVVAPKKAPTGVIALPQCRKPAYLFNDAISHTVLAVENSVPLVRS